MFSTWLNLLCENDCQRSRIMAVEPGTVLVQYGAEELCAEARNLPIWRQFPTHHVHGTGHDYNHSLVGEADTQRPDFVDKVHQVCRHRIRGVVA